jgi:methyl-accepting chemotaxis protein
MVLKIEEMATDLGASADQISSSAAEGLRATQHQNENLRKMLDGVNDMCTSAGQIAESSRKANDAAKRTGEMAGQGDKDVAQTIEGMGRIDTTVSDGARSVGKLGERSREIGQIIAVINDIADQTNLLALNAAIEAARAGEHGRGFAVVADEVRKLAERTQKATEEVAQSIREIQTETTTAVSKMQAGTTKVTAGVELAASAGSALSKITASSQNLRAMVQSIAAAAEEQSAASGEIAKNVERINAVTRESTQGATQSASAASQLSAQAETLQQLVGKFKI